jgi:SAM-dependent methyltransferase
MARTEFDRRYYERFYEDPKRRIGTPEGTERLVDLIAAQLAHLEVPIRSVLDLGCGLGWWRAPVEKRFPRATWTGVEVSEHLCRERGWERGSVVDWRGAGADLVVCQGVLQYLSDRDASAALRNLARLARRALYVEVVTREDWEETVDRRRSDGDIELRPADFYRRALDRAFDACGSGLYVRRGQTRLFELERGQRAE